MIPEISGGPFPGPCADQAPSLFVSPAVYSVLQAFASPWPPQRPRRSESLHHVGVYEHLMVESSCVYLSASPSVGHVEAAFQHLPLLVPAMKHRQVYHAMPRRCPIVDAPRSRHTRAQSADSWHTLAWRRRTFGVAACTSNNRRVCAYVVSTCQMRILLFVFGIPPNMRSQTVGYIFPKSAYLWRRPAALSFRDWRWSPLRIRTQPN